MSVIIQGDQVRAITQGILVSRAASTVAADIDIFSVDGGRVILLGLIGQVTVEIGAGSQDLELDLDPDDGGTNVTLATLVAADGDVVGTTYTLNPTAGGALVALLDVAYNAILQDPIILPAGDIVLDVTGTEAGEIKWDLLYSPLDNGASVSAV